MGGLDNKVHLLDVTLRDGGYKTNFYFSKKVIENTLVSLDEAGIDYIEVGYRNGSFKYIENIGPSGLCASDYLQTCRNLIKKSRLTVILHPKNIAESDIKEMKNIGVDCVRVCFPVQNQKLGFEVLEMLKAYKFEVFVNITRISTYSLEQLDQIVEQIKKVSPNVIYFADSNGNYTPNMVGELVRRFTHTKQDKQFFGFHAHDNLFLAQANAIEAINNHVNYIDASLLGLGKGAGNLRTEGIASYLNSEGRANYDLCRILNLAAFLKQEIDATDINSNFMPKDMIMGFFNLSLDESKYMENATNLSEYYNLAERRKTNNPTKIANEVI